MSAPGGTGGGPLDLLRSAPRVAAITDVLRRHGFTELLLGGGRFPPPAEVRAALEELGPVFVKLGQVLSTRSDLLPDAYLAELERLQEGVSPLPTPAVVEIVRQELGDAPEVVFMDFENAPLASGSIAQVHGAVTLGGQRVVVKVQRPDLEDRVREDMTALAQVASIMDAAVARLRPFDLPSLVREFRTNLEGELDFRREAANVGRLSASLAADARVWIPQVIPELSSRRVITMERSHGQRLQEYVEAHPHEAGALARRLGRLFIRQVFRDGLFQADPHPGNLFVMHDGVICVHDLGSLGEVDERMREALVDLLEATVAGDSRRATRAYLDLGLAPSNVDRQAVEAEVAKVVQDVRSRPLSEVSVGKALEGVLRLGARHRIRQPGAIMLLSRAFVTLEGVMGRLDPGLSFVEVFGSALEETLGQRFSPDRARRDALQALKALDRLAREAPDDLRSALRRLADGSLGRVVVAQDGEEAAERARAERDGRRLLAAGFLAVTGALLLDAPATGADWAGLAMLVVGGGVLLRRILRP